MKGIFPLKALKTGRGDCTQTLRQQHKTSRNITPPKNHNNLPVTDHKGMAILDLPNEKFKIAVLGKLNEIQNKDNSTKSGKQSMNKMSLKKQQKSLKYTKQTFWN